MRGLSREPNLTVNRSESLFGVCGAPVLIAAERAITVREVLFEFRPRGALVQVYAVDPETLTEVSTLGPATAALADLQRLALAKLEYVMSRQDRRRNGSV